MVDFRHGRSSIDSVLNLLTNDQERRAQECISTGAFLEIKGSYKNVEHAATLLTHLIESHLILHFTARR